MQAEALQQYRQGAPTRSEDFWGVFEVAYVSKAIATGGPVLRSPPGQLVFGGQRALNYVSQQLGVTLLVTHAGAIFLRHNPDHLQLVFTCCLPTHSCMSVLHLQLQASCLQVEKPDSYLNVLEYKTLGLLPGQATQQGTVTITSGTEFKVGSLPKQTLCCVGREGCRHPAPRTRPAQICTRLWRRECRHSPLLCASSWPS